MSMRLAVFYDYLETIGGGERVALTLAKHFNGDLITTAYDPELPRRAGFDGVRVVPLGPPGGSTPLKQIHASWRFSRARFEGYDFHVFTGNWSPFASRAHDPNLYYCLTPTRYFYDQRKALLDRLPFAPRMAAAAWTALHRPFERRAVQRCDRIIAISETVRSRARRYYGRECDVIYPPVATHRFRFKEIGDVWLSVNRLYPEKRIDLQLEIFRRLPRERLLVVGGYTRGDRTERYLRPLRPPPNVTFLGEVPEDELVELFAQCRGFLTTSVDEDFGIAPVEAMAAGKCVLATDEGGHRETVLHGRTGFLLPPDPEAFARTIASLDEPTLRSMKDSCIARAREFDETVFLRKMKAAIAT